MKKQDKIFRLKAVMFWIPALLLTCISLASWFACAYWTTEEKRFRYVDSEYREHKEPFATATDPFDYRVTRSLDELFNEIESQQTNGVNQLNTIEKTVSTWFKHGLSQYKPCENWVLYTLTLIPWVAEKYPLGLLDPKEIVQSEYAFCSQSAMVLQEALKHFGYEYASVGFWSPQGGGHFASAAKVDEDWYFLDANIATLEGSQILSLDTVLGTSSSARVAIQRRYAGHDGIPELILTSNESGNSQLRNVNEYPAQSGLLLQRITQFFSDFAWLLFLTMTFVYSRYRTSKHTNS